MTKKDAEQLVEIIFDSITGTLNKGGKDRVTRIWKLSGQAAEFEKGPQS